MILLSIYLLGIVVALIVAAILKRTMFKGMSAPFVMELPTYKVPSVKGVLLHTWEKTKEFIVLDVVPPIGAVQQSGELPHASKIGRASCRERV